MAVPISARLLGRFRWFFANFFFYFPSPVAGEPRPQHAIKQIREKQDSRHPFVVHRCDHENYADDQKARDRFGRLPIDCLKAGVLKPAKHHKGKKEQQRRQNEAPVAEAMFAFSEPEKEQRDRGDQTRRGGNRKTCESVLLVGSVMLRGGRIETSQAQRTAREVNECDDPARTRKLLQHDTVNHQRGRKPERNNVGERVELAPKRTLVPTEACKASVQKIKNECAKNAPNGGVK